MKKVILILAIFSVVLLGFSQVPITGAKLSDVRTEIAKYGGVTITGLVSAYANANASGFNTTYSEPENPHRLAAFRGYTQPLPTFSVSPTSGSGTVFGTASGSKLTFSVTNPSSMTWTVSITYSGIPEDWITNITKYSGSFVLTANEAEISSKSATVRVSPQYGSDVVFTVTQPAI